MSDERVPEGWRPEPGDTITGKVIGLDRGYSDYNGGRYYPIVTLDTGSGLVQVHCFHAMLENKLKSIRPEIGDRLTIVYAGQKPSKDGRRTVSHYTVSTDRPQDAGRFWDAMPGESRARTGRPSGESAGGYADDDIPF